MIIKKPIFRPSKPIGRDFEFSDSITSSNKKHYWNQGSGNLGFLTSEQIQTLRKLKQKQNRSKSNIEQSSKDKIRSNASFKHLNGQQMKNNIESNLQFHQHNDFWLKNESPDTPKLKKYNFYRRSKSQLNQIKIPESDIKKDEFHRQSYLDIAKKIELKTLMPAGKQSQMYNRKTSRKRIKTLEIEKNEDKTYKNSQKIFQNEAQDNLIYIRDFSRVDTQEILGQINPQLLGQQYQNEVSKKVSNQKAIESYNMDHNRVRIQPKKNQEIEKKKYEDNAREIPSQKHYEGIEGEKLYKSKKILEKKIFTRNKLLREYSPTFCNSYEYPLRYFRHV